MQGRPTSRKTVIGDNRTSCHRYISCLFAYIVCRICLENEHCHKSDYDQQGYPEGK